MSTPFRLQLPARLLREMVEQARSELPCECVGLLAGRVEGESPRVGRVLSRYPLVNAARSPTRFLSDDRSMLAAVKDMRRRQIDVLAVYHSHPVSDPIPSRTDLEHNYSSEVVNFIISLKGEQPAVRAWWLENDSYREAEWEVLDEGDTL